MSRKYQHVQLMLPQIKEMLQQGMTQKEVEKALGLNGYRPNEVYVPLNLFSYIYLLYSVKKVYTFF